MAPFKNLWKRRCVLYKHTIKVCIRCHRTDLYQKIYAPANQSILYQKQTSKVVARPIWCSGGVKTDLNSAPMKEGWWGTRTNPQLALWCPLVPSKSGAGRTNRLLSLEIQVKRLLIQKTRAISFGSTDLDFIFLCDLLGPWIPFYPIWYWVLLMSLIRE